MPEQKQRKALIVYASITGNTEKVALRFKRTYEKYGWKCDAFKVTKKTDIRHPPFNYRDYDMLCIGGPIWAGITPQYLTDDHLGILGYMLMPPPPEPGETHEPMPMPDFGTGWGQIKGISFVTYGGQGQGPMESLAALSQLELRLEGARIRCVGKFACCGAQWDEPAVDPVAARYKITVGDAVSMVARYKDNPKAEEFKDISAEDRNMFDKAVGVASEMKADFGGGHRAWHWDFAHRPNDRDLLKAEIFLSEILEDYYGGGVEMYPFSQYVCIA